MQTTPARLRSDDRPRAHVESAERGERTRRYLRGSNLLLVGRVLSLGINLLTNVLLVRYLPKGDYGAFAYALALGAAGASLLVVGMPRAVARFAPLYQERGEHGALFGSLLLSTAVVSGLGSLGLVLVFVFDEPLIAHWVKDPLALRLTLVLVALAPLLALDRLFQSMLTVFAGAGELFVRRYVLGPLLRLAVVLVVILASGGASTMAWAYLGATVLGLWLYVPLLLRALARADLLRHLRLASLCFRWRELLGYGLPLVVSDVMAAVRVPIAIVLLETLRDTREIADLSAFLKISGLNLMVLQSMKQLFLPVATRLLARGEHAAVDDIYWQTTAWTSLLTFPLFLVCILMPETIALVINGPGYVASSAVLVVLALGEFLNAALGLNTYTLFVYARVRFVVWTSAAATACGTFVAWLFVPGHGALGAAAGLTGALVVQNALHHWGLQASTGVQLLRWRYLRIYATQVVAILLALAIDAWTELHPVLEVLIVLAISLGLLRVHRGTLCIGQVYPGLGRLPLLGRFLCSSAPPDDRAAQPLAHQRGSPS